MSGTTRIEPIGFGHAQDNQALRRLEPNCQERIKYWLVYRLSKFLYRPFNAFSQPPRYLFIYLYLVGEVENLFVKNVIQYIERVRDKLTALKKINSFFILMTCDL